METRLRSRASKPRISALPLVQPSIYSAADAVSEASGWDGACAVVVVVIDRISNSAFEAMHTQKDLLWLLAARGREPATTRRNRTVAKIAKRRIGRPPDERYGRGDIKVPPTTRSRSARIGPDWGDAKPRRINGESRLVRSSSSASSPRCSKVDASKPKTGTPRYWTYATHYHVGTGVSGKLSGERQPARNCLLFAFSSL
jgi:hypothetical protein